MSRLRNNILANLAGQSWSAVLGLICAPLYIRFLGIEFYGLVGFYGMLQGVFSMLDFGLSPTINRELARYSTQPEKSSEARNMVRTLEVVYWTTGVVLGTLLLLASPVIATHWLKTQEIQVQTLQRVVMIMGLGTALQWPLNLYRGGLLGLQKHVVLNSLDAAMATLRSGGAVLILWLVSPTILAFFTWQSLVGALQCAVAVLLLWRLLPRSDAAPRVVWGLLRRVWRFAAGMSVTSLVSLLGSQFDRVLLSNLLNMQMFGYYTLARSVGDALRVLSSPVFTALFPHLSALVARGDEQGLRRTYHASCQLVAVMTLPAAVVVSLFSRELLQLWTHSDIIARFAAPVASILVIGTALNALAGFPYDVQIAHGWTRLAVYKNIVAVVVLGPLTVFLATHYGVVGAALVWLILNCGYVLIEVPIMHTRLLRGEMWRWYREDVGLPLAVTLGVAGAGRLVVPQSLGPLHTAVAVGVVWLATLMVCAAAAPYTRDWSLNQIVKLKAACEIRRAS